MNQTNQNRGDVNNRAKANRQQDIESLAAAVFVKMYLAERGTKLPAASAKDALMAAREFYKVVDQNEG